MPIEEQPWWLFWKVRFAAQQMSTAGLEQGAVAIDGSACG
jgi:hypothetical protein